MECKVVNVGFGETASDLILKTELCSCEKVTEHTKFEIENACYLLFVFDMFFIVIKFDLLNVIE